MILQILRNWILFQRSQWMTEERLRRIQARRLRRTVQHAYNKVPFYQRRYNEAGVRPTDVVDVASITKLPVIRKEELTTTSLLQRSAVDIDINSCLSRNTSGSTGTPLTTLEDTYSAGVRDAIILRFLWAYGVRPFDKICRLIPSLANSMASDGHLADKAGAWGYFRRKRSRRVSLADEISSHIEFFSKWKPKILIAPPSYFKALIRFSEENKCSATFRVAVTTGEILDSSLRKRIREKLQAEVFDYYGTEETGPLAWECPTHTGYHMNIEASLIEFLSDGEHVVSGEPGEIIATSFHRLATPIIRYATGDSGRSIDKQCACGRRLPLMGQVQGRVMDFIMTADGRYISPYLIMSALESLSGLHQYKVVQRSDYSIELQLKTSADKAEAILQNARRRCEDLLGENTSIDTKFVETMDSPRAGKFRVVESLVTK